MSDTAADTEFFSLAPLGFAGWEHTVALTAENGTKSLFLREVGTTLPHLVVICRGGSMLNAVSRLIDEQARWHLSREQVEDRWQAEILSQVAGRARAAA